MKKGNYSLHLGSLDLLSITEVTGLIHHYDQFGSLSTAFDQFRQNLKVLLMLSADKLSHVFFILLYKSNRICGILSLKKRSGQLER